MYAAHGCIVSIFTLRGNGHLDELVNAISGEPDDNPQRIHHNLHKLFHALATIACELESAEADDDAVEEAAQELLSMCTRGDVLFEISHGLEFDVPNPIGGKDKRVSFRYVLSVDEVDLDDGEGVYEDG